MARGRKDYEKAVIAVESEGYQDLHGRILLNDNFEDTPFKWIGYGNGTHYETRQQRAAYNGSFGAELDITGPGPIGARYSGILRYAPIDVTERLQMELFWRPNDVSIIDRFEIWTEYYDGTERHQAMIQWMQVNQQWGNLNDLGGVSLIQGGEQSFRNDAWNELTMSIDFSTDEYIRAKSNNIDINMGGIPCWNQNNATGAHVRIAILTGNTTANQLIVSIDDATLKELER